MTPPMTGERAVYLEPQLARELYGVICTQAFLADARLHYLTPAGVWVTMQPA